MDITWLTDRIAVGGGIWTADNMARVAGKGVTHIIDMQIEFDDTPLGLSMASRCCGIRPMTTSSRSRRRCFSVAYSLPKQRWTSLERSCSFTALREFIGRR